MEIPTIIEPMRGRSSWGNWCKHYAGLHKKTHCDAGVEYDSVKTEVEFFLKRQRGDRHPYKHSQAYPCFLGQNQLAKPCDKCAFPTDEEIAARDEETSKHINQIGVAREAILQELRRRFKEDRGCGVTAPSDISHFYQPQINYFCGAGMMDCPICTTGKLKYSRSTYNGHVHAHCSTDKCVSWME